MVKDKQVWEEIDDESLDKLRSIYKKLENQMRLRWNRSLPFDELISDRWERAKLLGFGEDANIYQNSYVYGDLKVGKHTWIGPFTILDGSGGNLTIGDYCVISSGVQIYTHNMVKWALTGGKAKNEYSSVKIGDCCYLGPYAIVEMGVEIGDHSIIGAHSFVNKSIPPNSLVFGIPAKVVGKLSIEDDSYVTTYCR